MDRIRVLNVITHFALGGATETVLTTCRYADTERFETAVLCGQTPDKERSLLDAATDGGIPVHILPSLGRSIQPLREIRAYREMVTWLQKHPWDVVHTSGSKAGILGRLAAHRAGVPTIYHTVFGWGHHEHMRPAIRQFYIALERRAARVTTKIITVSNANREKGLRDGIGRPNQYEVVYNGIDIARHRSVVVDRDALRSSLGIPVNAPVVGTVSRLAPQKAPEDFLRVAALVHAKMPAAHFVFVGGGPMQEEFEAGIREHRLESVVHFLGYRKDVPELLRTFDVFLLTSLWEGLPMVVPQAMCASLPCVATSVDGTPEAVLEGRTGYLAPPRDVEGLANSTLRLLGDEGLRRRMGRTALERVEPLFCERAMVRRIETLYQEGAAATLPYGRRQVAAELLGD